MTEDKKPVLVKRKGRQKQEGKKAKSGRVKIGVSIDEMLWRKLRAEAIIAGKQTGDLLDEAIEGYLKNKEKI